MKRLQQQFRIGRKGRMSSDMAARGEPFLAPLPEANVSQDLRTLSTTGAYGLMLCSEGTDAVAE